VQAAAPKKEKVKFAFIPVASGEGIAEYFMSIGASAIVSGGQTNNPSVDDFLDTFRKFDAEHIIVLPNNSNIIFTANQAAELYKDAPVHVIPTKSVMEGYGALSMANPDYDTADEVLEDMAMGYDGMTTAYVTTAIRDTHMDGLDVKEGQYIGLSGKHLIVNGEDKMTVAEELVKKLADPRQEIIMGFYGSGMTESEIGQLQGVLQKAYPRTEIVFIDGKQDVYDLILSL
jgi:dihydroxyacetone kinase-like predicted kinase